MADPSNFDVFSQRGDMSHQPSIFVFHIPEFLTSHFQNKRKMHWGEGTRSLAFALWWLASACETRQGKRFRDWCGSTSLGQSVSATYAWKDGSRPKGVEKSTLRYQHQDQSHFLPPRTCATGSRLRDVVHTGRAWLLNCATESPPCAFL